MFRGGVASSHGDPFLFGGCFHPTKANSLWAEAYTEAILTSCRLSALGLMIGYAVVSIADFRARGGWPQREARGRGGLLRWPLTNT